jgi:hypothetical protein
MDAKLVCQTVGVALISPNTISSTNKSLAYLNSL